MVRYYDQQGYLHGQDRAGGRHRTFSDEDVQHLLVLRSLVAAGLSASTAGRVAAGFASSEELHRADQALARSAEQARVARAWLAAVPEEVFVEEQLSLAFDLFLARTRLESLMSIALQDVGVSSGDYAILSLVSMEPFTAAGLARLVGTAPSSLAGRLGALVARGWLTRSADPLDPREWVLSLTSEGEERVELAVPHAHRAFERLEAALRAQGQDPGLLRSQVQLFSAVVRSMLPEA